MFDGKTLVLLVMVLRAVGKMLRHQVFGVSQILVLIIFLIFCGFRLATCPVHAFAACLCKEWMWQSVASHL